MSIDQHDKEIQRNRIIWEKKAILHCIYGRFYEEISKRIDRNIPGLTVELGSGIGAVKQFIPNCITSDMFANTWVDRVENAYRLSFPDKSVGNLVLFDVWHHLEYPGTALAEFDRVLAEKGRVILFEPAMGLLGTLVYGLFHPEPIGLRKDIEWFAPSNIKVEDLGYYAAQGNCWRSFRTKGIPDVIQGWIVDEVVFFPGIAYLLSGGFSRPKLMPDCVLRLLLRCEGALSVHSRLPATRMLVVLKKNA